MLKSFFQFVLIKTARKTFWKPYAAFRSYLAKSNGSSRATGRTAYGVEMVQCWDDRTFVYCHAGIYGRFLADELSGRNEPFGFVDVGANQGLYTLIAASNPSCKTVTAFEPVSATHALLEENIALNRNSAKVSTYRVGISAEAGEAHIRVPAGHSGMASLSDEQHRHADASSLEAITTVSAKELGSLLPDDMPLFVKVDVEGLEAVVIRQLLNCDAGPRIRAIFYEVDNRWSKQDEIAAMLHSAGFTKFDKVGFGRHFDIMAHR